MSSSCTVCKEITKKYKCSKCMEPYCSAPCFKEHQKVECVSVSKSSPVLHEEPTIFPPFKTEDTINPVKLEQLRTCEALKNLLYNPYLQSLLQEIDVAPNAWNAMRVAMQEPLFVEFADECLKVVEGPVETEP